MSDQNRDSQMDTIPQLPELEVVPIEPIKQPTFNESFGYEFPNHQIQWDQIGRYSRS